MGLVVAFPDVAQAACTYVEAQLTARGQAAPCGVRVPKVRPARFVLIRRLGGLRLNVVADQAQLGMEAWDDTEAKAHDLGSLVRSLLYSMRGTVTAGATFYRATELAGLASFPDPISGSPRYTATVILDMRGIAA